MDPTQTEAPEMPDGKVPAALVMFFIADRAKFDELLQMVMESAGVDGVNMIIGQIQDATAAMLAVTGGAVPKRGQPMAPMAMEEM